MGKRKQPTRHVMPLRNKIILFIFGILFIGGGIISNLIYSDNQKYYRETIATIVEINGYSLEEYYEDGLFPREDYQYSNTDMRVYVAYTVDGVDYDYVKLNESSTSMFLGQKINIAYDMRDPSKLLIKTSNMIIISLILYGIGGFLIIAVIAKTIIEKKQQNKNNNK